MKHPLTTPLSLLSRCAGACALLAVLAGAAHAQVTVSEPWARATVATQKTSGAFMTLTASRDTRLVEARSPVAGTVEIHEMALQDNVMRMRAIGSVALPAGKAVKLEPGGYHVMLMDLRQPLKAGDTVPLTLVFEGPDKARETVEVRAAVRALAGGHGPMKH